MDAEDRPRVLPHLADVLELHGADIVSAHNEGLLKGIQVLAEPVVVCACTNPATSLVRSRRSEPADKTVCCLPFLPLTLLLLLANGELRGHLWFCL